MTLRRRNYDVFRDERDFAAGQPAQNEIIEHIHRSSVFIVVWCREYACSPWCYDEFEIALERYKANSLSLWILQVDETRIVPPLARSLIAYSAKSREELEGQILKLLDQANPTAMSE
jgi:TIR domain